MDSVERASYWRKKRGPLTCVLLPENFADVQNSQPFEDSSVPSRLADVPAETSTLRGNRTSKECHKAIFALHW
ncbi:hypothetical protein CEXT_636031 [Caerostris extrusa]|uniref:Uncharacterized protein n=1 Tax=Caerostris extrusa TaxID=172846 RepID=A0AAV4V834_CAEEX|nr:hypothetical protein CEXT_636031 [Caerostris extrusa]